VTGSLRKQNKRLEEMIHRTKWKSEKDNEVLSEQTSELYKPNPGPEKQEQTIEEQNNEPSFDIEKIIEPDEILNLQKTQIEKQGKTLIFLEKKMRNILEEMTAYHVNIHEQMEETRKIQEELTKERSLIEELMKAVPDYIYFKDLNSRFIKINQSHAKSFGLDDPKSAIGKSDFDFFTEEHARPAFEDEMKIIKTGEPIIDKVEKETHPDGRISFVSTSKMPLYDYNRNIIGTFGISKDITEKVNMETEIKQRNEELQEQAESLEKLNELLEDRQKINEDQSEQLLAQTEYLQETNDLLQARQEQIEKQSAELTETNQQLVTLNATKDKFFSIIAHDLKNPFNNILGFCDLLVINYDIYDDERKKSYISIINESSKNIYKLLENLLQWARSQTGRLEFEPEEFLLNEIIDSNLKLVANMLEEKNLRINNHISKNVRVLADKNMINTVFRNIVSNSIKFTDNGAINISVKEEDSIIRVTVEDTGTGMSKEKQENLFSVGSSKSTKGTRGEAGTGLGLILCKEFVEKHGGTISVESETNKGTSISFTIPARLTSD
jgi:PAS domain S-box-containing protein